MMPTYASVTTFIFSQRMHTQFCDAMERSFEPAQQTSQTIFIVLQLRVGN